MHVKHRLTGIGPGVHYQPVAARPYAKQLGNLTPREHQLPKESGIRARRVVDRRDVTLGNHERVLRSGRVKVLEREHVLILEDDLGGDLLRDDLAEDAHAHTLSQKERGLTARETHQRPA